MGLYHAWYWRNAPVTSIKLSLLSMWWTVTQAIKSVMQYFLPCWNVVSAYSHLHMFSILWCHIYSPLLDLPHPVPFLCHNLTVHLSWLLKWNYFLEWRLYFYLFFTIAATDISPNILKPLDSFILYTLNLPLNSCTCVYHPVPLVFLIHEDLQLTLFDLICFKVEIGLYLFYSHSFIFLFRPIQQIHLFL